MSNKNKLKERDNCFYCSALISGEGTGNGDHFPIPKDCGGVETVPCCLSCHDMKDRFLLDTWPVEWLPKILEDFPKFNRETKLFLAKMLRVHAQQIKTKKINYT